MHNPFIDPLIREAAGRLLRGGLGGRAPQLEKNLDFWRAVQTLAGGRPGIGAFGLPRDSVHVAGINGPISFTTTRLLTEHMIFTTQSWRLIS